MTTQLKYSILFLFISVCHISYGQSIGIRGGFELADQNQTNNAFGGGTYLTFKNFSDKIHLMLSFDYSGKTQRFENKDLQTAYAKYRFSAATLFVKPLSESFDFIFGPSISYNIYRASHQGIILRWIDNYKSNFIGLEIVSNLQVKNILQSPLNIDFFITPSYLLNIKNNTENILDGSGTKPEYGNNSFNLSFQFGVTYTIKTKQ